MFSHHRFRKTVGEFDEIFAVHLTQCWHATITWQYFTVSGLRSDNQFISYYWFIYHGSSYDMNHIISYYLNEMIVDHKPVLGFIFHTWPILFNKFSSNFGCEFSSGQSEFRPKTSAGWPKVCKKKILNKILIFIRSYSKSSCLNSTVYVELYHNIWYNNRIWSEVILTSNNRIWTQNRADGLLSEARSNNGEQVVWNDIDFMIYDFYNILADEVRNIVISALYRQWRRPFNERVRWDKT